jgi:hypothetical protein
VIDRLIRGTGRNVGMAHVAVLDRLLERRLGLRDVQV